MFSWLALTLHVSFFRRVNLILLPLFFLGWLLCTCIPYADLRTILVWGFGLIVFYASQNEKIGEPWIIPSSFYTLLAFCVMLLGVCVYYCPK